MYNILVAFSQGMLLLITNDYPPRKGGVSWYYENLVALRQASSSAKAPADRQGDKTDVLKLGKWSLTPLWPFIIFPLLLTTIKLRPHHWWVGQVLPVGTVVWLLSRVWRTPYIVSTHGMDILMPLQSRRKHWLVKKILNGAEMITANSEWTRRKIVEQYFNNVIPAPYPGTGQAPAGIQKQKRNRFLFSFHSRSRVKPGMTDERGKSEKIVVVYPVPKPKREVAPDEVKKLRLELGIPESAKVLLTVARLVARKGIGRVLKALPEVWREIPDLHFIIVGDGEESSQLLVVSRQLLGSERVHFVGVVSDEELAAYYTMADAFILLPREEGGDMEGFGIVYVEANQYGIPIIGCISGGTGEALSQCQNVLIVNNPNDPKGVAEKICQAFQ